MNKFKGNKKGTDKVISVYWFAILFIVAGGIVYMVSAFYGNPYDVREIEAGLLSDKTAGCISYAGYLREGVLSQEFKDNFPERCNLNFEVEDTYGWKEQGQYFLKLNFYDFNSYPAANSLFEISAGNPNLDDSCNLEGEQMPFCLERELYVLAEDGKPYTVKIISAIGKTEKNIQ